MSLLALVDSARAWPFVALIVLVVGLAIPAVRALGKANARDDERREALREEYRAVEGWPVDLLVRRGKAVTGYDRGVVWFEEGRLLFVGRHTSFGLAASQVRPTEQRRWESDASTGFELKLRPDEDLPLSIRLTFLTGLSFGSEGYRSREAFRQEFRAWLAADLPTQGQLPPLALAHNAPKLESLLLRAGAVTAAWSVISIAYAMAIWRAALDSGAIGVFFVGMLLAFLGLIFSVMWADLWEPRQLWLAWRDRRRLEVRR